MIQFQWRGVRWTLDLTFLAVAAWLTSQSGGHWLGMVLSACLLHELGHLTAMAVFHQKVQSVTIQGAGILICPVPSYHAYWKDMVVWLAGPAVNLAMALLGQFWHGTAYGLLHAGLFLFNMLPYAALDGGALCKTFLLSRGMMPDMTERVCWCISLGCTVVLISVMAYGHLWNLPLCIMLCLLLFCQWKKP